MLPPTEEGDAWEATSDMISRALGAPKPVNKPDISRLPDAIVGGIPQFGAGDKIVIERYSAFLKGRPYLDTKTYTVEDVDAFTGKIKLYDDQLQQHAIDNWKTGTVYGNVYKLAMGHAVSTKKKRGRPRKDPVGEVKPLVPPGEKRGRGRPPGVKNRPKAVIAAEKAAKKAAKSPRAAVGTKRKGLVA
jgi:hypothetical protein